MVSAQAVLPDADRPDTRALEAARRRLFAPGATADDRALWLRLQRASQAVAAVPDDPPTVEVGYVPPEPRDVPPPARPSRRRRVLLTVLVAAVLAGLGLAAASVRPPAAGPSTVPVATGPAAPALGGTTLLTMTNGSETAGDAASSVVWNSGWNVVRPQGAGLALALRCTGTGRVEVVLTSGERFAFPCGAATRTFVRSSAVPHPDRLTVLVPTTGAVIWSLRLVARPVPSRP